MVLSNPTKFPVNIPIIQFWECFVWRWCPPTYKYGMLFLWMCWMGSKLRRRKFRSQTCDSMEGWKSKGGKSPRRERKKKSEQRRDRKKKQDPGARKGRKVAKHCVFPWFCGGTTTWQGGCGRESVAVVGRWSVDHGIPITLSIEYGLQSINFLLCILVLVWMIFISLAFRGRQGPPLD